MTEVQGQAVLQIVIMRDGGLVGTEVFPPGQYVVGRDPDSDLLLDDARISGCHATLLFADGKAVLQDQGSANGVLVNGNRVAGCEIRPIDDVTIGPFTLKIRVTGKKAAPRTAVSSPTLVEQPAVIAPTLRSPLSTPPAPRAAAPVRAPVPPSATAPLQSRPKPAAPPRPVSVVPPVAPASASFAVTAPQSLPIPAEARPPPAIATPTQPGAAAPLQPRPPPAATPPAPAQARPAQPRPPPASPVAPPAWTVTAPQATPPVHPPAPAAIAARPQPAPAPVQQQLTPPHALPFLKEQTDPQGFASPLTRTEPDGLPAAGAKDTDPAAPLPPIGVARPLPPAKGAANATAPMLEVRVLWGSEPVAVRAFPFGATFRAGPGEDFDVPLYGFPLPEGDYSFAIAEEGRWVARIPRGVTAAIRERGNWSVVDVDGLAGAQGATVALKPGAALRMTQGGVSVELLAIAPQPMPKVSPFESFELRPVLLFAAVALAMGWALVLMPEQKETVVPEFNQKTLAPIRAQLKPPEKAKPSRKNKTESQKLAEKATQKREQQAKAAPKRTPPPQNVNQAIKTVQKITASPAIQNILAATSKITGNKGYGDKGTGYKLNSLNGKPPVAMAGNSFGEGLGGFGTQTKGIGALRGTGGEGPGGFAIGKAGKKGVAGMVVQAPSRQAVVRGSLGRDEIAKVINDHIQEIRGCYERALLKEPGLGGKLVIEWTIGTDGRVAAIKTKTSTVKGASVPNCVISSLKAWRFPKPKGGPVVVSYPFIFNSMGF